MCTFFPQNGLHFWGDGLLFFFIPIPRLVRFTILASKLFLRRSYSTFLSSRKFTSGMVVHFHGGISGSNLQYHGARLEDTLFHLFSLLLVQLNFDISWLISAAESFSISVLIALA